MCERCKVNSFIVGELKKVVERMIAQRNIFYEKLLALIKEHKEISKKSLEEVNKRLEERREKLNEEH